MTTYVKNEERGMQDEEEEEEEEEDNQRKDRTRRNLVKYKCT
jgi:hypothetical protein